MNKEDRIIEVIESEKYSLEDFLNDVVACEKNTRPRDRQNNGENIYKYIKEHVR